MPKNNAITHEFSVYLDGLRFAAAYYVLLFHLKNNFIGENSFLKYIPNHGHDAVILFFVLSGYVIAATVDRKKAVGWREYFLDRAARVYSVAAPTLILCMLVTFSLQLLSTNGGVVQFSSVLVNALINFFFLGQSWSLKEWVPYNQPYWSLCYEVMYYVLFGIAVFAKGLWRWFGLVVVALIAGPKVMLLLPCWLLGVLAYQWRDKFALSSKAALLIGFVLPLVVLFVLNKIGYGPSVRSFLDEQIMNRKEVLEFSNDFLIDYTTAILVAINLYAARYVPFKFPVWISSLLIMGASISFTLYLMHLPMVHLIVNIVGDSRQSLFWFFLAGIGIPVFCYFISQYTELKRFAVRDWLASKIFRIQRI